VGELLDQVVKGGPTLICLRTAGSEWSARPTDVEPPDFPPAGSVPDYYPPDQTVGMWLELTDFEQLLEGWAE